MLSIQSNDLKSLNTLLILFYLPITLVIYLKKSNTANIGFIKV